VLAPAALYTVLQQTASDMQLRNLGGKRGPQPVNASSGFDYDTGFGLVDAVGALQAIYRELSDFGRINVNPAARLARLEIMAAWLIPSFP
jgi:hypothetical protein